MARQKGCQKYGGRKPGSLNRTTREAKLLLNEILFGEIDSIHDALQTLKKVDPAKYLDTMAKLLSYSLPRKTDVTSDDEAFPPSITITVASSESRKQLQEFLNDGATVIKGI